MIGVRGVKSRASLVSSVKDNTSIKAERPCEDMQRANCLGPQMTKTRNNKQLTSRVLTAHNGLIPEMGRETKAETGQRRRYECVESGMKLGRHQDMVPN